MLVNHLHLYVKNAAKTSDWLITKMGFQSVDKFANEHTSTEILTYNNSIFFLISSPLNVASPVYNYLNQFASGVSDVAFQVENISPIIQKLSTLKDYLINSPHTYIFPQGKVTIAKVRGFGCLHHTLIENNNKIPLSYWLPQVQLDLHSKYFYQYLSCDQKNHSKSDQQKDNYIRNIDHIVLNVAKGKLTEAVEFYRNFLGFQEWQKFQIKTHKSGLLSQALICPYNSFYFNINEPTSSNSQIQEFIDFNGGSGIQHIALGTTNIIKTVIQMRSQGLDFLTMINNNYYDLKKYGRNQIIPCLTNLEWQEIEKQQILVDCDQKMPESLLMQIFTKPIFNEPTLFFELIERRKQAQGFGEGNFQALFEIIEQNQTAINNLK